jgi:catechol 2,3-dioxygenase-like lactoylglutathione lyase family enzyme
MLLAGLDHIAAKTNDTERLCRFYKEVFDATVMGELREGDHLRLVWRARSACRILPQSQAY